MAKKPTEKAEKKTAEKKTSKTDPLSRYDLLSEQSKCLEELGEDWAHIKDDLEIVAAKWIDEVLETALQFQPTPKKVDQKKKASQGDIDATSSEKAINTH